MQTLIVDYKELRSTYQEIKAFLRNESYNDVKDQNTRIAEDLELWGSDNYLMLVDFIEKYDLNFENFEYEKYFVSEGEYWKRTNFSLVVLMLPFYIPFYIIAKTLILLIPSLRYLEEKLDPKMENERLDLTFGDLLVSKLKGEFCLRKDVKIQLK